MSELSTVRPPGHSSEYDKAYKKNPQYMADQRARMKARYWAVKRLGEKALEGKDLDHIKPLAAGGGNAPSNWRIRSVAANRGDKAFLHEQGYHARHVE
jgi:hypothetical protein